MIFKIAKAELRHLFYSPVAWFLAFVFWVQGAMYFTNYLYPVAKEQDLAIKYYPKFRHGSGGLTARIFGEVFNSVLQNLYLFVPMLTMGLISREINNGTIKLLYSSPVKLREIVFGKFLGIMFYNMMLLGVLSLFMVTGIIAIHSADYGMLLSAALGFYLLICAYAAIGLFMSCLTNYQIVSAIATFTIVFILTNIGSLWQKYDFIRDLTYFLSLSGRTYNMLKGLITTKDVIYFILIIGMFLFFALIKLKGGRESKPWTTKFLRYLSVMAVVLAIGYFTSLPRYVGYWDATATKSNTIHPRTQKIIKKLGDNDPLEVTLYTNLLGFGFGQGLPENRNEYLSNVWEPYLRFKPDIKLHYVYYYDRDDEDSSIYQDPAFKGKTLDQIAKQVCEDRDYDHGIFISRDKIRKLIDLKPEAYRLVMQLRYKGRSTFLRVFPDFRFWPDEGEVAPALERLMHARIPKVGFLMGDIERNIYKAGEREYSGFSISKVSRPALINSGFDCDTINADTQEIPADITTLVLADPKTSLSDTAMHKIRNYINHGGNMLILGEPGKQQMLNPLLKDLGVQMQNGILVNVTADETPDKVDAYLNFWAVDLAEEPNFLKLKKNMLDTLADKDSLWCMTPGTTGLMYKDTSGFMAKPLFSTRTNQVWLRSGVLVADSVAPVFDPQMGDSRQPDYSTMVALTRQKDNRQQRIVVCGDADFVSNLRGNSPIVRAIFSWLSDNEFPIYTPRPELPDNRVNITAPVAASLRIGYIWVLPGLILLIGTILLIRRKRK